MLYLNVATEATFFVARKDYMLNKIKRILFHNAISNRLRQITFGWKCHRSRGVTIWYQPVKTYPGYKDYDYEPMFERAVRAVRGNKKLYPGRVAAIESEVYYSGGRPGIGTRRVQYTIQPYRKVF